jgi:WhiB family redox-sensing transcriptional regulator
MTLTTTGTDTWIPTDTNAVNLDTSIINKDPDMHAFAPDIPSPPGIDPPDEQGDAERFTQKSPVARCADGNGTMTGLFFSDHVVDIARAKAMCGLCPLAQECLAGALEREEPWGVWGGELLSGGRIIGDKRPCGRPPKHPRPAVVYDEMGPVGIALTSA